jgi:hypothetical protein
LELGIQVVGYNGAHTVYTVGVYILFQKVFWPSVRKKFPNDRKKTQTSVKVIYPKYSKHWPYTVASTIDCGCSKMLNHGLNHGFFLSLFKLIPCPINWIVCVLAYLNFIFEF